MEKPAPTKYPVHELIRKRWSPRAFAEKPVEREILHSLLEAAHWSASSFNEQPWRYIVTMKDNPAEFEKMLGCLVERNQRWAKAAPVLMLSLYKKTFSANGSPNRCASHDVGAASAQLTFEATARGLFVHQMGGIEVEKIKATYQVPADFEPMAAVALGYPGNPESLSEDFRKSEMGPRERKPWSEIFFSDAWAKPLI